MRSLIIAAVAALAFASAICGVAVADIATCLNNCDRAQTACDETCQGSRDLGKCLSICRTKKGACELKCRANGYVRDAKGMCHATNGQFVATTLCAPPRHPVCNPAKSKSCGDTCIALDKVCRSVTPRGRYDCPPGEGWCARMNSCVLLSSGIPC